MSDCANLLAFMRMLGRLKHLKRTGWVKRGVSEPESVAAHMYRMAAALLVLPLGNSRVDRQRALRMALVHDMAEALVGDITPYCGVSAEEKHRRELEALTEMTALLEDGEAAEVKALFVEYEAGETEEAKLVHDMDKLDLIVQADEYERNGDVGASHLQEFFDSTSGVFRTDTVLPLVRLLRAQRSQRLDSN